MFEYRTEVIPIAPGEEGATTRILNAFASEGWRAVSLCLLPVQQGSPLDPRATQTIGLLVILERTRPAG